MSDFVVVVHEPQLFLIVYTGDREGRGKDKAKKG